MKSRSSQLLGVRLLTAGVLVVLAACGSSGSSGGASLPAGTDVGVALDMARDEFAFPNFGAAASAEQFDAPDVVSMFGDGPDICASGSGDSCVLTAEAATWARMVNQARQSGHCEGFAVMAAARFMQALSPKTAELANSGDVTSGIMRGFATQFIHQVKDETDGWAKKSVSEKVVAIDAALKQQKLEYALGVYSEMGGHAVLPWKITYLDDSRARIHVYDSNWPGVDRYVTADVKKNTWSFSFSGQDPENDPNLWTGKAADMDLASMSSRESGGCPFCDGDARVKSSMFVIRSAALDWSVATATGDLSPQESVAGDNTSRPLKAADSPSELPSDYFLKVLQSAQVRFTLPSETHLTGVTPGAAIEVQTTGEQPSTIEVSETSISTTNEQTVLTLAAGNLVATANGASAELTSTNGNITVQVQTTTGETVNVVVDDKAPAVEIRTPGNPDLPADTSYQILTQTATNEITTKTVTESGKVTETVSTGTLSATSVEITVSSTLAVPEVDPSLPPAIVRDEITSSTTTTTTTSTTTTTVPKRTTTTTTTTVPTTTTTVPTIGPWAHNLSVASNEQYQEIVTDGSGNVYTTGYFCAASITIGPSVLTNKGQAGSTCDTFVEKINPSGDVVWAIGIGGSGQDFAKGISVDTAGNVYFALSIENSFQFAGTTMSTGGVSGGVPMYGKINSSGTPQWGATIASTSAGYIDIAAGSDVYVAVNLAGPSTTVSIGGTAVTTQSSSDVAIAKINPTNGAATFVRTISGGGYQQFNDVKSDGSGNVFVTGTFTGTSAIIGIGGTSVSVSNATNGVQEGFTTKLNSSGAVVFAKAWGGTSAEFPAYLAIRSDGYVYTSFKTSSPAVSYAGTTVNRPSGSEVMGYFVSDATGVLSSAKLFAGSYYSWFGGMDVDDQGNVYLAGTFSTFSLTFGSVVLDNPSASDDIFYVKVSSSGNVLFADSGGGSGTEYMQGGGGVAVDSSGNPVLAFDSWSPTITIGSRTYTNQALDAYLIRSNPSGDLP